MGLITFACYWVRRHPEVTPDPEYVSDEGHEALLASPEGAWHALWKSDGPPDDMISEEYSNLLGETIYLGAHDRSEYFHCEVWLAGKAVRKLLYTQDRGWERAQGEAQPWETAVVFYPGRRERHLATHAPSDHPAIEEAWARRNLRAGDRWPMVIAMELVAEARAQLRLPD